MREVLVGLPLLMSGEEGRQAALARSFGDRLAERGFDVIYWDERLTSWQAEGDLRDARGRRDRSLGTVDSAAARIVLQEYLDARRRPLRSPQEAR